MIYVDLILNLSLLVAISVISDFVYKKWQKHSFHSALQGLLFGSAAVLGMLRPFVLSQGLIFDGRSVVISLCSYFYGPLASLICGIMTIACRLLLAGKGTIMGISVIFSSCLIGLIFYQKRQQRKALPPSVKELYYFGITVHLAMLAMTFTLPFNDAINTLNNIALPVMLLYPLATILVGKLLADQETSRLLNQRLQQAQKMESIGRLAGGVAHDFNNMLSVIMGNAELAMEKLSRSHGSNDPAINDELKEIIRAGRRSADLTQQLLAFARKQDVAPRSLNLNQRIETSIKMLRRLIGENIKLYWRPGDEIWTIRMDPGQLDQILANLVVNARDALTEQGMIEIRTQNICLSEIDCHLIENSNPGEYVLLEISDNGKGIDKAHQAMIFEPFFTTKKFGEGTGLGLATVYGIVTQNKGFLELQSESGKGTSFRLYFPKVTELPAEFNEAIEVKEKKRGTEIVLVVEDEPAILNVCSTVLERLGYKVISADTPEKALKMAENFEGKIDLLITDMVLPGINGIDLAVQVKQLFPEMREIFISGYSPEKLAIEKQAEKLVFLQKPFSLDELADKIRHTMNHKSS